MRTACTLGVVGAIALAMVAAPAGAVTWPTEGSWQVITAGGMPYSDPHGDVPGGNDYLDIVGDSTHPGGFLYLLDPTDIMFRMRVDQDPTALANNKVYAFLIDTDGDCLIDYSLQLDDQFHHEVELVEAIIGGPYLQVGGGGNAATTLLLDTDQLWPDNGGVMDASYYRFTTPTADGYDFHTGGPGVDAYVDVAMPWNLFTGFTGLTKDTPFRVTLGSTTSHAQMTNAGDVRAPMVCDALSDPVIPEPATAAGLILAAGSLAGYIRRRRAA